MSTVVAPGGSSIDLHDRRPVHLMVAFLAAVGFHMQLGLRMISDLVERRFADFADVPYLNPLSRQQWEELWETEAESTGAIATSAAARAAVRSLPHASYPLPVVWRRDF